MHCTKSQTFSNSCAQNRHSLLAKIVQHIDGTSGAERGSSADPTLVFFINLLTYPYKKIIKRFYFLNSYNLPSHPEALDVHG